MTTAALLLLVLFGQVDAPPLPAAAADAAAAAAESAPAEATGDDDAWVQEARDWLVACRVANDRLSPQQTEALTASFAKLKPAGLRVLMMVYEQTYQIASPLSAADRRAPDQTEAEREWIVAYRILYEGLSAPDAKKYGETLRAMKPGQIRALVDVYKEKARLQAQRGTSQASNPRTSNPQSNNSGPSEAERAAQQRALQEAQARMEFEQQRRQMALGRASMARSQTNEALVAANATTAVTAAAMNDRLNTLDQRAYEQSVMHQGFQNSMYQRSSAPNPYNNVGYFRLY